jgi:protein-disulfide isomerase/uncharacterized membrane protein
VAGYAAEIKIGILISPCDYHILGFYGDSSGKRRAPKQKPTSDAMFKRTIFPAILILLCLAGLTASFTLAEEYYYLNLPPSEEGNPAIFHRISSHTCGDKDSFFSCANVTKSRYAALFGIPLAVYGIFFYLVTLWTACAFAFAPESMRKPAAVLLFWVTLLGVVEAIVLLVVTLTAVKALCPLCLLTYMFNLLLWAAAGVFLIRSRYNPLRPMSTANPASAPIGSPLWVAAASVVLIIVSAAAGVTRDANAYLIRSKAQYIRKYNAREVQRTVDLFARQAAEDIDPSALPTHGDPSAPVTIIEFSDFLCPYCAHTADLMNQLAAANPGVQVRFVNFPLDITCNRFMRNRMHRGACDLALGAICAAEQGLLDAYQHAAFGMRLNDPTPEDLRNIVALSGVSEPEFGQCLGKPGTLATLQRQIAQAHQYDITSTPTLYINKKRVTGRLSLEALQKIVDMETQSTGRKQP